MAKHMDYNWWELVMCGLDRVRRTRSRPSNRQSKTPTATVAHLNRTYPRGIDNLTANQFAAALGTELSTDVAPVGGWDDSERKSNKRP